MFNDCSEQLETAQNTQNPSENLAQKTSVKELVSLDGVKEESDNTVRQHTKHCKEQKYIRW